MSSLLLKWRRAHANQAHRTGIRLIQRRIVNHQPPAIQPDTALHLRPQRFTIRRQALQQARVGVMRDLALTVGMAAGGFRRAEHLLRRDQKVDVVVFTAFGSVHAADFSSPFSTA